MKCLHGQLSSEVQCTTRWLQPGSPAYNALARIVLDKRLDKDLEHLAGFQHTGKTVSHIN